MVAAYTHGQLPNISFIIIMQGQVLPNVFGCSWVTREMKSKRLLMKQLSGVCPILCTPFTQSALVQDLDL